MHAYGIVFEFAGRFEGSFAPIQKRHRGAIGEMNREQLGVSGKIIQTFHIAHQITGKDFADVDHLRSAETGQGFLRDLERIFRFQNVFDSFHNQPFLPTRGRYGPQPHYFDLDFESGFLKPG